MLHLLLLPLILLLHRPFHFSFGLLLFLIKALSLLTDRITNALLNLSLALTNPCIVLSECLIFGVLQLVVVTGGSGAFPLSIPLQTHLHLAFKALFTLFDVFSLLLAELLQCLVVLTFKIDFLIFYLIVHEVL